MSSFAVRKIQVLFTAIWPPAFSAKYLLISDGKLQSPCLARTTTASFSSLVARETHNTHVAGQSLFEENDAPT